MGFSFDGEPRYRAATCPSCGNEFPFVTAFVTRGESARAIVYAACHTHDDASEVWLDVIVGSFDEPEFADQATFSCRVRSDGATLFPAPVAAEGRAAFFGRKLTVDEARAHDGLPAVWALVDFVVTTEPTIRASVYGSTSPP